MSATAYSPLQKSLHWLILVLVLLCYGLSYVKDFYPREDADADYVWWVHISFGMLFLALVLLRVLTRLALGAPGPAADAPAWESLLAQATHLFLYVLMIVIPVLGVILTWLRGNDLTFFKLFSIPAPIGIDLAFASIVKEAHNVCAGAILVVAGVHAAAALWHHYVRSDNTLRRMLPGPPTK